jgi:hypothetical protein
MADDKMRMKMGLDGVKVELGEMVSYYAPSGECSALVTRVNPDGSCSLTVFTVGEIVYRDMVLRIDDDMDESERVGFWEERWDR